MFEKAEGIDRLFSFGFFSCFFASSSVVEQNQKQVTERNIVGFYVKKMILAHYLLFMWIKQKDTFEERGYNVEINQKSKCLCS